jgi:hypothetical protein
MHPATWFCFGVIFTLSVTGDILPAFLRGASGSDNAITYRCDDKRITFCREVAEFAARRAVELGMKATAE